MNLELLEALNELMHDRGISKEIVLDAIDAAIVSAYKRNYNSAQNVRVELNDHSGQIRVFARKEVVEEVSDPRLEISLDEARAKDPNYQVGDVIDIEVTPRDFGRIAAQTAKQVVVQRIREAERDLVYEEYKNRVDDIINGFVQRREGPNILVDLGKVEAMLPPPDQLPNEPYRHGDRIKAYIVEVKKTTKGPVVVISRTHPGLIKRLFELEVPEIYDGVVVIKSVAREPGHRSKIAVATNDLNVDPVGACVGQRGSRVQSVVNELRGEKIDIIPWDPDPARLVANALSPAKVIAVYPDPTMSVARVVVPDTMLSLAIGRDGQNARLAARLTGWKIDIKSDLQMAELEEELRLQAEREAKLRAEEEALALARAKAKAGTETAEKSREAAEATEEGKTAAEAVGGEVEAPGSELERVAAAVGIPAVGAEEAEKAVATVESAADAAGLKEDFLDELLAQLLADEPVKGAEDAGIAPSAAVKKEKKKKTAKEKGDKAVLKGLDALEKLRELIPDLEEGRPEKGAAVEEIPAADKTDETPVSNE